MKIVVDRKWKQPEYTIGLVYINGKQFCNSLEDTDRGLSQEMSEDEVKTKKVYGKTAIPTGTYKVTMSYSNHFKKYLPEIHNVKGYSGVRIHSGNTADDSLGCILLGKNTAKGMVTSSRAYCSTFNTMLDEAIKNKEEVTLTIK